VKTGRKKTTVNSVIRKVLSDADARKCVNDLKRMAGGVWIAKDGWDRPRKKKLTAKEQEEFEKLRDRAERLGYVVVPKGKIYLDTPDITALKYLVDVQREHEDPSRTSAEDADIIKIYLPEKRPVELPANLRNG
jgi:hypothetical protein